MGNRRFKPSSIGKRIEQSISNELPMRKSTFYFSILLLATAPLAFGQDTSKFFSKGDSFFKDNVKDGLIAYADLKSHPAKLDELIDMARQLSVSKDDPDAYQAFWINGYNLLVIKGIVDHYPIKSPLDIDGFFDSKKHEIGGNKITLDYIENQLLRKNFPDEPRFHFVLVCGALGCPPILDEAYMPSTLDGQLEEQTKKALNDPEFIRVNNTHVKVSQIFEWYNGDFTQDGETLVGYINQYRTKKLPEDAKVSYYKYDWTLNKVK